MTETFKYIFAANLELMIEAYITPPAKVNLMCAMEDAEPDAEAECEIEEITCNGEYFESDGIYLIDGLDKDGNAVFRELDDIITDAILAGECDQ